MAKEPQQNPSEIGKNLERLEDLLAERKQELEGKISMIGTTIVALSDPENRLASYKRAAQRSLDRLPQKGHIVAEIIQSHAITAPIDDVFLSEMLLLSERFLNTPPEKRDEMFKEHEDEIVARSVGELRLRRLNERIEREGETEYEVKISSERNFKFYLSEDHERIRMEIPMVLDFSKYGIMVGPEAVYQILGDKITKEDYFKIAKTLLSMDGSAGKVMRAYKYSVETWAEMENQNMGTSAQAREVRRMAAVRLRQIVGGEDPRVAPLCDIPLNAIYVYAAENYPYILKGEVPQPFMA